MKIYVTGEEFNKHYRIVSKKTGKELLFKSDAVITLREEIEKIILDDDNKCKTRLNFSNADICNMVKMRLNGHSLRKIAKEYKTSHETIRKLIRENRVY